MLLVNLGGNLVTRLDITFAERRENLTDRLVVFSTLDFDLTEVLSTSINFELMPYAKSIIASDRNNNLLAAIHG